MENKEKNFNLKLNMSNQNTFNNIIMREIIIFPQNDILFYFKTTLHNSSRCEILYCAKLAPKFPISVVNLNNSNQFLSVAN